MKIWTVCKDSGGTNGILPVFKFLRELNHDVSLIANGKAVELLKNENPIVSESAEHLLSDYGQPDILITSMCSYGGVGRNLVPLLRGKCPIVALQDLWGASLVDSGESSWGNVRFRPDYLIVNDGVGKRIVLDTWRDYRDSQVLVLGYPALDKYATLDILSISKKVRTVLGLKENKPIVLFGGWRSLTAEMLSEIVKALNSIGGDFYFVPRPHPRTKDNFQEEMMPWQEALAELKAGTPVFDFFGQTDTLSLLTASDLVISMYSTILVEAAALRKQNISVLYPKVMDYIQRATVLQESPLVELGCSAKAADFPLLRELLVRGLRGELGLKEAQEKNFRLDGKNAERVARFVEGLK